MKYLVNTNGLNIRNRPSVLGQRMAMLPKGTEVNVITAPVNYGDWHWVQIDFPIAGWAAFEFLKMEGSVSQYETTDYVNVRIAPLAEKGVPALKVLPPNTVVNVYGSQVSVDGIYWFDTDGGWICATYLKVLATTAVPGKLLPGFHILDEMNNLDLNVMNLLVNASKTNKFFATVINNKTLANILAANGCLVVFRPIRTGNESAPSMKTIQDGYNYAQSRWPEFEGIAPSNNIWLQFLNEQAYDPGDNFFYIGVMQFCESKGYRACIFNDATGNPSGTNWLNLWQTRVAAMQLAYKNGHACGGHYYSNHDAISLSNSNESYFASRFANFYDILPDNAKAMLFGTELGTNNGYKPDDKSVAQDIKGIYNIWKQYPYARGFAYWQVGGTSDNWKAGNYADELESILTELF